MLATITRLIWVYVGAIRFLAPTVEPNSAEPKRLPGLVPLRSNSAAIAFRI
ncbi:MULTISPECIES: hypothetical protein [Planktothricoides]|uniref:Uncharacterized protein n=1 Tax=Planktothricoides raciborskii FACHB-1370 TaxID=2949576 RepID=A0ABR8E8K0_9CYAN|nr:MULTISPECIES: hypothetical protein [Planktothricoides]MBD2543154.1 hypothetical protein [Planktothricoides raciborskii FACHB-1370]MBD2580931.1 hypothetical protein [Planktothricoides raciborskii FACHB-1261]